MKGHSVVRPLSSGAILTARDLLLRLESCLLELLVDLEKQGGMVEEGSRL